MHLVLTTYLQALSLYFTDEDAEALSEAPRVRGLTNILTHKLWISLATPLLPTPRHVPQPLLPTLRPRPA